jgi:hypothetical protein
VWVILRKYGANPDHRQVFSLRLKNRQRLFFFGVGAAGVFESGEFESVSCDARFAAGDPLIEPGDLDLLEMTPNSETMACYLKSGSD